MKLFTKKLKIALSSLLAFNVYITSAEETYSEKTYRNFSTYGEVGYDQKLRPQFHFTSRKN